MTTEKGGESGVDRREVLSVVAAGTVGLAGCSGGGGNGGDGGGGGGDGGSLGPLDVPDSGPSDDPDFCGSLLGDEYTRYDGSESPFVATFEYPSPELDVVVTATVNDTHALTIRGTVDGQPFDVMPSMNTSGTEAPTAAQKGEVEGLDPVGTIDYDGETLTVVRADSGSNGDDQARYYKNYPYYVVGVPYGGSSGKRYYRYDFRATVQSAENLSAPVCSGTWEVLARQMVASLEPNPDTTVEA